jgi:hypothetical protein
MDKLGRGIGNLRLGYLEVNISELMISGASPNWYPNSEQNSERHILTEVACGGWVWFGGKEKGHPRGADGLWRVEGGSDQGAGGTVTSRRTNSGPAVAVGSA